MGQKLIFAIPILILAIVALIIQNPMNKFFPSEINLSSINPKATNLEVRDEIEEGDHLEYQEPESEEFKLVEMEGNKFVPEILTIKLGDVVKWKNEDQTEHTVTADDGSFDSGNLIYDGTSTLDFTKPGTYTYHCKIHPEMKGTIIVEPALDEEVTPFID